MKKELQELIKEGKIVVAVYQNTDEELNRTTKTNLKNIWKDEKTNITNLLGFLYNKTILKTRKLTIKYNYNYSDKQTIKVIYKDECYDGTISKTEYVFYNIPTIMGCLDVSALDLKLEK